MLPLQVLAAASHDNFIDLYHVARSVAKGSQYKLYATCSGHSSYITGIDFRCVLVVVAASAAAAAAAAVLLLLLQQLHLMSRQRRRLRYAFLLRCK
jgi:hypothetical protein